MHGLRLEKTNGHPPSKRPLRCIVSIVKLLPHNRHNLNLYSIAPIYFPFLITIFSFVMACLLFSMVDKPELFSAPTDVVPTDVVSPAKKKSRKKKSARNNPARINLDDATVATEVSGVIETTSSTFGLIAGAFAKIGSIFGFGANADAEDKATFAEKVVELASKSRKLVAHMPDNARGNTLFDLTWIFMMLIFGSVTTYMSVFYIPLAPPDAGFEANRYFFWLSLTFYGKLCVNRFLIWRTLANGVLTRACRPFLSFYLFSTEAISWLSWLGTLKFLLPNGLFPWYKRATILLIILAMQKFIDCGRSYHQETSQDAAIFPIPYSMAMSSFGPWLFLSLLFAVVTIPGCKYLRPDNKTIGKDVLKAMLVIWILALSQLIAVGWGLAMHRFRDQLYYQLFVGMTPLLLRPLFKNILLPKVTLDLAPVRFIILHLVVDVQFTMVQVVTTPFIRSPVSFGLLILAECAGLAQRTFSGMDRLILLAKSSLCKNRETRIVRNEFGNGFLERAKGLFGASVPHISWCYIRGQEDLDYRCRGWMDRALFNFVDEISVKVISIMLRTSSLYCIRLLRTLPTKNYLNENFRLSDDEWNKANAFGWSAILVLTISVVVAGKYRLHVLDQPDGRKVSLNSILGYVFRKHFWFWFLWLITTGSYMVAAMIVHFGFDYSLEFMWQREVMGYY